MKVIYNTRSGRKEGCDEFEFVPMEELLAKSDFISLHIPYDKEQGPLIGPKEFEKMKDGVFIINCARGGILDEESLLAALESGKVAAAALDVYEQEPTKNEKLYTHSKICLTPHIGASTIEAQERIGKEVVEIIKNRRLG
jgi:D-3-phosphoglycerate dehydrogenase